MRYPLVNESWGEDERRAILEVLDSGRLTMGPRVKEFERKFASYIGSKYAVMVNSGSSANLIATAALSYHPTKPLKRGDEAIVPAIGWSTTYSPLQQHGVVLRVMDVDIDTLNMDVSNLEMTPKTRLLVGVNILGNPAALNKMKDFAEQHGLWFMEDNCESMGAALHGHNCGTWGDIGTFSMFFSHHLNTIEGGVIVTDSEVLYELCLILREHGWDRCLKPDGGFYNFVLPGYNVRPTEIAGAVGLVQLEKAQSDLEVRRRNAALFNQLFKDDNRFILQRENGSSSWFSFTMICEDRKQFSNIMKSNGIEHRSICGGCFTEHPSSKHYDYHALGDLTNAKRVHYDGLFVGNCGRDLTQELNHLKATL